METKINHILIRIVSVLVQNNTAKGKKDAIEDIEKNDYKIYLIEIPLDSINFEKMKDHFIKVYDVGLEYFPDDSPYKNGYNNKMKKEIENKLGINIKIEINNYFGLH